MNFPQTGMLARALLSALAALFLISHTADGLAGGGKSANKSASPQVKETRGQKPSNLAVDVALGREIDRLIGESGVRARLGVFVMSQRDGRVLYSRDGDKSFTPASNMKIYTTAIGLDLLGGDYRWRTSVYAGKQTDTNGLIDGDLTLYGRGAPDLVSKPKGDAPSLAALADQLYQTGARHVRGDIVGDASYFRGELFGIGWQWNDLQWYFGAEPSALSIDENTVEVTMSPAARKGEAANVVVTPNQNFIQVNNEATTGEHGAIMSIGIIRDLSDNKVRVWGDFPAGGHGFSAFLAVHDPALWSALLFKQALIARGIKVDGQPRSRDFRDRSTEFDPQKALEVAHTDSEPLSKIVKTTNKESNNLFAELILRTVGKERGASVPDPDPRKNAVRGDDEAGTVVVRSWLEAHGIETRSMAIRDGSGLSRLDLITPEATAKLLAAIAGSKAAVIFHDSLPVAGRDGTLGSRLKPVAGRVFAKTGTLTYTHSLSGYADTSSGETLVFSILCNDAVVDREALRIIDQIAATIAEFGKVKPS
jgi:D-alanyl-D-alanine carboxypeptidase/D-alanyl-D-alanine-endopeptidase (penicillin-binding protein 4)